MPKQPEIRRCRDDERASIVQLINEAAEAYRNAIPQDCWKEPYMPSAELETEISDGVCFWGYDLKGTLSGIMGIQSVCDVDLIRHAYVSPRNQRQGIGAALLEHLRRSSSRPLLVGTWAAATWAIDFYRRHGFTLVSHEQTPALLRSYWKISRRQLESSVVLVLGGLLPELGRNEHGDVPNIVGG